MVKVKAEFNDLEQRLADALADGERLARVGNLVANELRGHETGALSPSSIERWDAALAAHAAMKEAK